MEIIRDYQSELIDAKKLADERKVIRAVNIGIITQEAAQILLTEIWRDK